MDVATSSYKAAPIASAVRLDRRSVWKYTAAVAGVIAIFFAGYFLGQRENRHPQVSGQAPKWGDPVWSDDFNGGAQKPADPSKWTYDVGNHGGWGNKELEIYCPPQGGDPRECNPQHPARSTAAGIARS
jgi:hypothetical protein